MAGVSKPRRPRVVMSAMAARTAIPAVAGQMGSCWPVTPDHVARAQFMELCARIANRTEPCAKLVIQDMTTAPVMVKAKKPRTSVTLLYGVSHADTKNWGRCQPPQMTPSTTAA